MSARVVQLTDLHLCARIGGRRRGSDVWGNLDAVLRHLRAGPQFDLLVLTGDIASQRRPATYRQLRERLQPWLDRVRVLPGNHDSRRLLRAAFGDLLLPGLPTANFALDLGGWRLLGLDSVRRPFVHGKFGAAQLRWLAGELQRTQLPVLLFLHHPPIAVGCWWLDKDRPRDRHRLASMLTGSGVRAIACGHVHQDCAGTFAGVPVHAAPAVAYQFLPHARVPGAVAGRGPGWRWIELRDAAVRTGVERLGP
jgi:3',5'-cyclic-AMP phosphodiesterase